ncbi:MAG TPA: DUF3592 domain-containing protein [Allosphingosinicella sp.]|jgi:hypothetical protein
MASDGIVQIGFLALLALGALFIFLHLRANKARAWPAAPGIMLASTVREPAQGTAGPFEPLVHYRYQAAGRELEGVRLRFRSSATYSRDQAYAALAPYAPGNHVHVRYNPHRPEESVLEPGAASPVFLVLAGVAAALFLAGVAWIVIDENSGSGSSYSGGGYSSDSGSATMLDNGSSGMTTGMMGNDMGSTAPMGGGSAVVMDEPSMIGRWARSTDGDCSLALQLNAGSAAVSRDGQAGLWSVATVGSVSTLNLNFGGEVTVAYLDGIDRNHVRLRWTNGSPASDLRRC